MTAQTPAVVRTSTPPAYAGALIYLAQRFLHINLDTNDILVLLPVVSAAFYIVVRALETWKPALGYILGVAKQPAYSPEPSPSPADGEDVEAVVVPDAGEFVIGWLGIVLIIVVVVLLVR